MPSHLGTLGELRTAAGALGIGVDQRGIAVAEARGELGGERGLAGAGRPEQQQRRRAQHVVKGREQELVGERRGQSIGDNPLWRKCRRRGYQPLDERRRCMMRAEHVGQEGDGVARQRNAGRQRPGHERRPSRTRGVVQRGIQSPNHCGRLELPQIGAERLKLRRR
jgi:hypothetical protein